MTNSSLWRAKASSVSVAGTEFDQQSLENKEILLGIRPGYRQCYRQQFPPRFKVNSFLLQQFSCGGTYSNPNKSSLLAHGISGRCGKACVGVSVRYSGYGTGRRRDPADAELVVFLFFFPPLHFGKKALKFFFYLGEQRRNHLSGFWRISWRIIYWCYSIIL